ncbi:MAG: hypothetical protein EBZ50_00265 [Alphaproteobacteria bacterium]|nr:hypothetical protein [Alphaproteobacteria bacterium]
MTAQKPRTAFVFAGGGSLGAIQVGALQELIAAGERPDLVVGASVGALNACFFAARPSLSGVEALADIWRGLRRGDVFPISVAGTYNWLRGQGSLFETSALRRLIDKHLPFKSLEDAEIPVHVVATNLSGAAVCLSRGAVADAILASAAIPIAFPTVQIGDEHLMDGAVAGNTPILTAAQLGASRIIVLQTGYACSISGPPKGAVARGMHALTLMISNQMERDLKLLETQVEVHVTPHLCPLDVSPFNFERTSELIERGALQTRAWLDRGGLSATAPRHDFDHHHEAMAMSMPAAGGFDLVSYFSESGLPRRGSPDVALAHEGRTYLFAEAANRDLFAADPERYLPRYGGLCAFAMARGAEVRGDPTVFRVHRGRLYFNLNAGIMAKWVRDIEQHIHAADDHWAAKSAKLRVAEVRG